MKTPQRNYDGSVPRFFKRGSLTITVFWEQDDVSNADPEILTDENNYDDCGPRLRARYLKEDAQRLAALRAGDWSYLQCGAHVSVKTATNWSVEAIVGRAYLCGIESDSGTAYLREVEGDMIDQAILDAQELLNKLAATDLSPMMAKEAA